MCLYSHKLATLAGGRRGKKARRGLEEKGHPAAFIVKSWPTQQIRRGGQTPVADWLSRQTFLETR